MSWKQCAHKNRGLVWQRAALVLLGHVRRTLVRLPPRPTPPQAPSSRGMVEQTARSSPALPSPLHCPHPAPAPALCNCPHHAATAAPDRTCSYATITAFENVWLSMRTRAALCAGSMYTSTHSAKMYVGALRSGAQSGVGACELVCACSCAHGHAHTCVFVCERESAWKHEQGAQTPRSAGRLLQSCFPSAAACLALATNQLPLPPKGLRAHMARPTPGQHAGRTQLSVSPRAPACCVPPHTPGV